MKYIKYIISIISILLSIYLINKLNKLGILPNKYLILISILLVILNVIGIILIHKKNNLIKTIVIIIYILFISLTIIGIKYTNETINFFKNGFNNNIEIKKYNVLILKTNNYKLEELRNIGYLENLIESKTYLNELDIEKKQKYKSIYELYKDLIDKKIQSIILDESYIELFEEDYKDIIDKTKIIYSFDIKKEIKKDEKIKELKPINIYISGSDSRSGLIETNSRTDVNMIMTINPEKRKILLTSIPRDYYVRLHGTTGYKDKLTHSGIYGIEMSKHTLEDVFNIKIDYTVKVGFNSVIEIVDLIGGIDINSDKTFTTHCGDGGAEKTYIKEGINHLTGPQALSYARERYAYTEGDNHRIQNQQQVLEAIITSSFKNKNIIKQYKEFLESFKNLYRTDIPDSLIKLYIKNQLEDNKPWTIEKQVVKGTGDTNITYSMPGRYLYVMNPDKESIEKATKSINNLINS